MSLLKILCFGGVEPIPQKSTIRIDVFGLATKHVYLFLIQRVGPEHFQTPMDSTVHAAIKTVLIYLSMIANKKQATFAFADKTRIPLPVFQSASLDS